MDLVERRRVERRLESWRHELRTNGHNAKFAPKIIRELEAELAAKTVE